MLSITIKQMNMKLELEYQKIKYIFNILSLYHQGCMSKVNSLQLVAIKNVNVMKYQKILLIVSTLPLILIENKIILILQKNIINKMTNRGQIKLN